MSAVLLFTAHCEECGHLTDQHNRREMTAKAAVDRVVEHNQASGHVTWTMPEKVAQGS